MRLLSTALVTLALAGWVSAEVPVPNPPVDPVLQQLDQVGKSLHDFTARVKLIETDNTLLNETIRAGTVWFQKRPDGSARIRVLLDRRLSEDQKRATPEKIEYLLDGAWLVDRNYQTKTEVRRQVLKPGQKMDLFKLGEGPFPMPIGQDPQDVHRLFDVKSIPPAKDDPAGTVHLQLIPRPNTDLSRKTDKIDVWVDQKTHMPTRIDTAQKQTTRSTELKDIVVNSPKGLSDADFALPNIDQGNWNRHVESLNP